MSAHAKPTAIQGQASELSIEQDPILRFRQVFERACQVETIDCTAGTLATADEKGRPSARVVLLKQFDEHGFVIFTNLESRKARELRVNPYAALCFYWPHIGEQVRLEGAAEEISAEEADAYFATRPRGSRIGAWASRQSEEIDTREELLARYEEYDRKFPDEVPRPPFWGGFRIVPQRIEFWINRDFRLHDRFLYMREGSGWRLSRLSP